MVVDAPSTEVSIVRGAVCLRHVVLCSNKGHQKRAAVSSVGYDYVDALSHDGGAPSSLMVTLATGTSELRCVEV
jgi:hypothetical protein